MQYNIKELLEKTNIINVVSRSVSLSPKGNEHIGLCPFHKDTTPSLNVNEKKQIFKCFGCGKGGDAIDFLVEMGATLPEACAELDSGSFTAYAPDQIILNKRPKVEWKHIFPAPKLQQAISHYKHGIPTRTDEYKTPDGEIYGYACRFDLPDGSKEVLPYVYATDGKRYEWRWLGFSKHRYPFNIDLVTKHPEATILIVEGEKTASYLQKQFDPEKTVVVTWLGGANGIRNTSFGLLAGKNIILWPDNDDPGTKAMQYINKQLKI